MLVVASIMVSGGFLFVVGGGGGGGGGGGTIRGKCEKRQISKIGLGHFLSPIGPLLHAKFQKNRWSGFRETAVTNGRTDGRTDERR